MASYKIAAPDEYLAVTGMGVKSVKITKAAWIWPFQRCVRFSVQPRDYAMNLQAMTKEKLQFMLPVVFTVGPYVKTRTDAPTSSAGTDAPAEETEDVRLHPDDALTRFAMLLANTGGSRKEERDPHFLENIVKGIIEGETRVLVSSMTMEEIFTEREVFKKRIFRNIQGELSQFGLFVYNSNVKELRDAPDSNYFDSLSRKAHEGASNQARIDVAEAQLKGNVGEAKRKGEQDRELAKINAETAVQKTLRDSERATAEAELAECKLMLNKKVEIARITAQREAEEQDEKLKKTVEIERAAAEIERLRASDVVKATIAREAKEQAADAKAYEIEMDAKADLEKQKQSTDASAYKIKVETDASAYKVQQDAEAWAAAAIKNAEANLQKKIKEAEGLTAMANAYGAMCQALGGPQNFLQLKLIETGTYVELAKANASAIKGLNPKISVWNTGAEAGTDGAAASGGAGAGQSSTATLRNIYQMLPPLMSTLNEQTGLTLPEWQFGRMATELDDSEQNGKLVNGSK
ncbi:Flotillin-like protein 1 [Rhypophila decipiens]|uniref:Flotillin-like protein 1 n=1 Tax=Rhypophila decipiens TaxID=261697 RepID=A0AAN7BC36_9PEZI|nr:Flotillin-like protein 1 [Rhypophila decipiens]